MYTYFQDSTKKKFFSCSCVRNAMKNIIFNNQDYNLSYVKEKHEREEKKIIQN